MENLTKSLQNCSYPERMLLWAVFLFAFFGLTGIVAQTLEYLIIPEIILVSQLAYHEVGHWLRKQRA